MSTPSRAVWFLLVPLVAVGLIVGVGVWWYLGKSRTPAADDGPAPLADVVVPQRPTVLAWSPDGAYLAAGAWGWGSGDEPADPSEVYAVDIDKGTVAATLKATGAVHGLAFSPDGKWLAVVTQEVKNFDATPAVLVVFDVPRFAEKFTAKSKLEGGFRDLAWAGDSKSLSAIDSADAQGDKKAEVRGWSVPAFTERRAIRTPQLYRYEALAVSPDGGTLAVADVGRGGISGRTYLVRLFDAAKGAERASSRAAPAGESPPRLGFTADGKSVGVFPTVSGTSKMSWWDTTTAKAAEPDPARFAVQPAGLADPTHAPTFSIDGTWRAHGSEVHRGLGDLGWGDRNNPRYGSFIHLTRATTQKTQTWRASDLNKGNDVPAGAFSPDGTRLAGNVKRGANQSVRVWAVPK